MKKKQLYVGIALIASAVFIGLHQDVILAQEAKKGKLGPVHPVFVLYNYMKNLERDIEQTKAEHKKLSIEHKQIKKDYERILKEHKQLTG